MTFGTKGVGVTEDGVRLIVVGLGVFRYLVGVALLVCGFAHGWAVATVLLLLGFLADAADGSLARFYGVVSKSGAKLDYVSAVVMMGGAAGCAVLGGLLPWVGLIVLLSLYALWHWATNALADGDIRDGLRLLRPVVYMVLVAIFYAAFFTQGFDLGGDTTSWAVASFAAVAATLLVLKRKYLHAFINSIIDPK